MHASFIDRTGIELGGSKYAETIICFEVYMNFPQLTTQLDKNF